ncbi:hypothetical protein Taro_050453 [Colocasia esculenta]|uniref:Uncharacterized protein n=1 Tax=Colocasia esculenta TaxID=4460 RepID=A0A843XDX3_COLES|nr:hypothetical protein [Colocasia esculenta]
MAQHGHCRGAAPDSLHSSCHDNLKKPNRNKSLRRLVVVWHYLAVECPHTLQPIVIYSCHDCWLYIFYNRTDFFAGLGSGTWTSGPLQRTLLIVIRQIGLIKPYRKGMKSHYQLKDDFERMIQLSTPSLDSESGSTPISTEEAFVSVMGKDRSGRVRCGDSRETLCTWYGTGEGLSSSAYQQQISSMEDVLRTQGQEME